MSGTFEVAKFHGMDVAIFDSHWFANKIIKTNGKSCMCSEITASARFLILNNSNTWDVYCEFNCADAMMPYRDFMSVRRIEHNHVRGATWLNDIFSIDGYSYYRGGEDFRLETARRMLAVAPIRYCIPFEICQ